MPEKPDAFVNPSAPPGASRVDVEATPSRLTNADFRRLLMTPRSGGSSAALGGSGSDGSGPVASDSTLGMPIGSMSSKAGVEDSQIDKAGERRRKKSYYAKLKRAEEDIMSELAKKYRDRAKERREGDTTSTTGQAGQEGSSEPVDGSAGAYRAVAPDLKSGRDAAERRRQQIQESKFLGGDMEHTHLVKGLDYALLQKVRSEILAIEQEHELELDQMAIGIDAGESGESRREHGGKEPELQFKTKLAKNIHRVIFSDNTAVVKSELFMPGRMAYRIDLDDELISTDIPTTLIRSKADCPQVQASTTLTTNDIVINKLTQVLSYLRQGRAGRRLRKKDRTRVDPLAPTGQVASGPGISTGQEDIFQDAGEYEAVPGGTFANSGQRRIVDNRDHKSYFGDTAKHTEQYSSETRLRTETEEGATAITTEYSGESGRAGDRLDRELRDKQRYEMEKNRESNWLGAASSTAIKKEDSKKMGLSMGGGEYAECYPGFDEMHAAMEDSDEEADFTKMDQGNRKGPMGRWDFANTDEYSDYMNRKEALPRAAFQYGVKMADGRKTQGRRLTRNSEKSEKSELDREWQKISALISKRKSDSSGKPDGKRLKQ